MATLDSLDDHVVVQCVKESGFDFARAAASLQARLPDGSVACTSAGLRYKYAAIANARAAAEEAAALAASNTSAVASAASASDGDKYKDLSFSEMMDIVNKTTEENMVRKEQIFTRVLDSLGDAPLDAALYAEVSGEAQLIQQVS